MPKLSDGPNAAPRKNRGIFDAWWILIACGLICGPGIHAYSATPVVFAVLFALYLMGRAKGLQSPHSKKRGIR